MRLEAFAAYAAAVLLAAACTSARIDEEAGAFDRWSRSAPIAEFEHYLAVSGLGAVIPTRQLVRTATDWRRCGGPRFEIPPRDQWPEVRKVLSLIAELKSRRILSDFEAVSNFRNPVLNACAGGAKESAHAVSFAIDIVARQGTLNEIVLCEFWSAEGKAWEMGLGKYRSGRIHLDTSRYRSWGWDHKAGTSLCGPFAISQLPSTR
jgi:hypothetical protein